MTTRDRKLLLVLVPIAVFAAYWLLLMNPALDRRAALEQPLAEARAERDTATARAEELEAVRERYRADYAELVKLSRAIPSTVATSDLMRELNAAARGTGIEFSNISMSGQTVASGEEAPGAVESTGPAVDGLDTIPVELTFEGGFFGLADLFRRIQRSVDVTNGRLEVRGRLVQIDGLSLSSTAFPDITAQLSATVYTAPLTEGDTGGATPVGPAGAERGDGSLEPVSDFSTAAVVQP